MSDQRSPSYLSDSYRKKLRYNLFSAISSNLRSNITVALGNLDIISEGNSVQYIDESIHDVKNSLNNLQLLAQQMDNLAEMNTPDFVNKNVDLIKILNIIVENLKSLAAQKNIELVFLSEVDRFVAICSPLMLDRLFGHILSILIRSSKPSTSVTLLVSELSKDNLDIKILFTPIFDISPNDININQYHLLLSQPDNIIDSIIIDTISETYGYTSAVVADGATERDVHVQAQRRAAPAGAFEQRLRVVGGFEARLEAVGCGVRGVPGPAPAEPLDEFMIDDQFVGTRLRWQCDGVLHGRSLFASPRSRIEKPQWRRF